MGKIAKIALIHSEIDVVLVALNNVVDLYDDNGNIYLRDVAYRVKEKISKAVEKNEYR